MERNEFLSKLGIGVMAVCTGCALASCGGSKSADPTPSGTTSTTTTTTTTTNNGGPLLSADLSTELAAVGSSKVANGIILVRIAAGNTNTAFTAVQVACTHQGTAINYDNNQGIFVCPLHGSEYDKNGNVIMGPAVASLKHYTVSVSGNSLTVS